MRHAIDTHAQAIKKERITRWKRKLQHSASKDCHHVFHHPRNRLQDEPPNLVQDSDGNILFQPDKAMERLNQQWDTVYAANTLSEHPLKMLETVWPYICHKTQEAQLPPIDASARSNPNAEEACCSRPRWLEDLRVASSTSHCLHPHCCFLPMGRGYLWGLVTIHANLYQANYPPQARPG